MKRKQDGQELEFERLPKKPPISLLILLLTQRSNHISLLHRMEKHNVIRPLS